MKGLRFGKIVFSQQKAESVDREAKCPVIETELQGARVLHADC